MAAALSTYAVTTATAKQFRRLASDVDIDLNARFAIDGDASDQVTELATMRTALAGDDKPHFQLHAPAGGIIGSTTNTHIVQVLSSTWNLHGASLKSLTASRTPLNSNSAFRDDVLTSAPFGDAVTGHKIDTCLAGATSIFTATAADAGNYTAGMRILIYGFDKLGMGEPPAPGVFEWNEVETSGNAGTGEVVLKNPTRFVYNENWVDYDDYIDTGVGAGAPRILSLDRGSSYIYPKYFALVGGTVAKNTSPTNRGDLYVSADHLHLERMVVENSWAPGICRRVTGDDVLILEQFEVDKIVGSLEINNLRALQAASGAVACDDYKLTNFYIKGAASGAFFACPKHCTLDTGTIHRTQAAVAAITGASFPTRVMRLRNVHFTATEGLTALGAIARGSITEYTIPTGGASGTSLIVDKPTDGQQWPHVVTSLDPGYSRLALKSDGSKGGLVLDIIDAGDNFEIQTTRAWADADIIGYCGIHEIIDEGGNRSLSQDRLWAATSLRFAGNRGIDAGVITTCIDLDHLNWASNPPSDACNWYGILEELEVVVNKPFTGSNALTLTVVRGPSAAALATINLKVSGRRVLNVAGNAGTTSQSGDTISNYAAVPAWAHTLTFALNHNGGSAAIDAADRTSILRPTGYVKIKWRPWATTA